MRPALMLLLCLGLPALVAAESSPQRVPITLRFDYEAAERLAAALDGRRLDPAEARRLAQSPGIAAVVRQTGAWIPGTDADDFVADLLQVANDGVRVRSPFQFGLVQDNRAQVAALVAALRADEAALAERLLARLRPYAPDVGDTPLQVDVFYVAAGLSDGFVLEDDAAPACFIALDRALGDRSGVEQNLAHELYHVLQKAAAQRSPAASRFMLQRHREPAARQLLANVLWEGSANFALDPRDLPPGGPYLGHWRESYRDQLAPQALADGFARFEALLAEIDGGRLDWRTAYRRGFTGRGGGALYFVGFEMSRALAAAHGPAYFRDVFAQPPERFFLDYLTLPDHQVTYRFSADTAATLRRMAAASAAGPRPRPDAVEGHEPDRADPRLAASTAPG